MLHMITYLSIFFDTKKGIGAFVGVLLLVQCFGADQRKGVQQNAFADHICELLVNMNAVFPK